MGFMDSFGRWVFCWVGCWISFLSLRAQFPTGGGPIPTQWKKVEIPNGPYPKGKVNCMMQDHFGFIWVGGVDGLYRFDGNEYVHYFHQPNYERSLSSNHVTALQEDANGDIWIGTLDAGLNVYRREREDILPVGNELGNGWPGSFTHVNDLLLDREGKIWVATSYGLFWTKPDPARNYDFHAFGQDKKSPEYLSGRGVKCIAQDSTGAIWIASDGGYLSRWGAEETGEGKRFVLNTLPPDYDGRNGIESFILIDLQVDPSGTLWIGHTAGASFRKESSLSINQLRFELITEDRLDKGRSRSGVEQVYIDPWGHEWLMSNWGIHRMQPDGEVYSHHPDKAGLKSKGFNAQYAMLVDRNGGFWLGCQEGLYRSPSGMGSFHQLPIHPDEGSGRVTAIHQDRFGQFWLGLEENGLVVLDAEFRPYLRINRDPNGLLGNFVMDILEDSEGDFWVGTYGGGLHRARVTRLPDGRISECRIERLFQVNGPSKLDDPYIYTLLEDKDQTLWAATFYGIWRKRKGEPNFRKWKVEVGNDLAMDKNGTIWAATDQGLFRIAHLSDSMERQEVSPGSPGFVRNGRFTVVGLDYGGRLWVGGPNGLIKWGSGNEEGFWLRDEDGQSEMSIRALIKDANENFWLSTPNHLVHYDPATHKIQRYTQADGILNQGFALRSAYRDGIGNLYFGGDEGLTWFHPDSLHSQPIDAPVYFTRFLLNNEWILPARSNPTPLAKSILLTDTLYISPAHKVFSLEFAALDFRFNHTLRYRYRLLGFDAQWQTTQAGENSLTYTNLDPGTYTLEVAALSPSDVQGATTAQMVIIVQPPWWRTLWAKIIYIGLALALLVIVWRLRMKALRREIAMQARIAQARSEERERVRSASSKDFHDEAGNRLTRLSLYTALLRQQTAQGAQSQETIDRIDENIQSLTTGMRDFIWVLDPQYDSLHELLLRLAQFGEELVAPSAIRFHFRSRLPENLPYVPDARVKRQLLLVFKEAMHNALRHAQPNQITLEADISGNSVVIILSDDGIGFDQQGLGRVNGLKNMQERAAAIGAKMEIESAIGKGTVVKLILGIE